MAGWQVLLTPETQNKLLSIANEALETRQQDPRTELLDLKQSLETGSSLGLNEAGTPINGWEVYLNNGCHDCRIVVPK